MPPDAHLNELVEGDRGSDWALTPQESPPQASMCSFGDLTGGQAFDDDINTMWSRDDGLSDVAERIDFCMAAEVQYWFCPAYNSLWAPATDTFHAAIDMFEEIREMYVPGLYIDPQFMFHVYGDRSWMMALAQVSDIWRIEDDEDDDLSVSVTLGSQDTDVLNNNVSDDEQSESIESEWIVHDSDASSD